MKQDEKACPMCAETIKRAAQLCKHCGHKFPPEIVAREKQQASNAATAGGCVTLAIIVLLIAMCSGGGGDSNSETSAKTSADERRKGFHCLSAWDGSSGELTQIVKAQLRDPDSFEHVETRISPVDEKGQHAVVMKYRARNGFGGMNVETAIGTVSQATCGATLLMAG